MKNLASSHETAELQASAEAVWKAQPVANLNDCLAASDFWQLKIAKGGTGNNGAAYTANVSGGAGGNCDVLVPGFGKLDATGVVSAP